MKKPYIVKPCPEMYRPYHIECDLKLESSISIAVADCPRHSPSVTDLIKAPNLHQSSSQQRNHSTFYAFANAARMDPSAIMNTKNISASSFDLLTTFCLL